MRQNILVTGGAGYIGSHMVLCLADAGYRVAVADNLSRGFAEAVRAGRFVQCDLCHPAEVEQLFAEGSFNAVLHFAGYAYVGESVAHPDLYYRNNLVATLNVLDAMHRHQVRVGVMSSTCATFGLPQSLPINEDHPQAPITPYGRSKLMVEQAVADYVNAFDLRIVCLRYFNAAGADPQGRSGNRSVPQTRLIPLAIQTASGRRPALQVFGRDYATPDGTCIRDYIHVSDLCTAHLLALEKLLQAAPALRPAYNLGYGHGYSVQEVICAVERHTQRRVNVEESPRRPGDPATLIADPTRAIAELGWHPRYNDLDTIVAHEWAWEQIQLQRLSSSRPGT